ncbi:MAG TPA: hypothetical protein VK689_02600 [Armatimonadota bacterium]|nr:hypothetical protein [Armatimonadota bacterium]
MSVEDPPPPRSSTGGGQSIKCGERAGFLIPRPCRNPATIQCPTCGKWVCGEHTATLQHGGLACTSCAANQNVGPAVQQRSLQQFYGYGNTWFGRRAGLGGGIHVTPGYTHADYDVFDREPTERDLTESVDGS